MPINLHELVSDFGVACLNGNGAVFVGAGLSTAAGLPTWADLLKEPRKNANIPDRISDLPLVAEYLVQSDGTSAELERHILQALCSMSPGDVPPMHELLSRIPVREIWTTNYDELLEQACSGAVVVTSDEQVRDLSLLTRTIFKMHGSIDCASQTWVSPAVMTRSSFESYEADRPRTWALLRATYLSRTMLFLGFSFADPNIELLLSLARRYKTSVFDRHLTVLKRPHDSDADAVREHELRVADLEASGVRVCEVDDHAALKPLLEALVRRTRPAKYFISGSAAGADKSELEPWSKALAVLLAREEDWETVSLGGEAGWPITRDVAALRREQGTYEPSRLAFYFRSSEDPAPPMERRIGNAVYTDLVREELVQSLLTQCRTMLVVRGGSRSSEEIDWALAAGVDVVPVAGSGGAAAAYWDKHRTEPPLIGGRAVTPELWEKLGDADPTSAAVAAVQLLRQGMYADE